jgi:hypothetical protein
MNNNEDADNLREWADDYLDDEDNSLQTSSTSRKRKIKGDDDWIPSTQLNTTSSADSYDHCKQLVKNCEYDFKFYRRKSRRGKWLHISLL